MKGHVMLKRILIPIAIAAATATIATAASASSEHSDLAQAKHATAQFRNINAATNAGYGLFTDAKGIACIDMPGMGAMGVHYVKGALVGDPSINATTPEALVYEPQANGKLKLVALEYVVLKADWDALHSTPPSLFGQPFNVTAAGNRYGLPAFYSLHAWIWKHNPAGTFAMWNPNVTCTPGSHDDGHGRMEDMPGMGD
jgi:hypothetical protein